MMPDLERLEQLGFVTCATKIKEEKSIREKLTLAYQHFRYVTPEKVAS